MMEIIVDEIIKKMQQLIQEFEKENKTFSFFGLFKKIDLEDFQYDHNYDIIVSFKKGFPKDYYDALGIIITKIHEIFSLDDRMSYLGSVFIFDKSDSFMKEAYDIIFDYAYKKEIVVLKNITIEDMQIKEGFILIH